MKQFPLLDSQAHPFAYLDSAATTQKPLPVIEAVESFYRESNSNVHRGVYPLSEKATSLYESSRKIVARFLNAETDEVIFTSGATASLNQLALSLETQFDSNDAILLFEGEHHSNLLPWLRLAERRKCRVLWIPISENGSLDLAQAEKLFEQERIKLLAVATVSHVLGNRHPFEKLVRLAKSKGALTVLDATQSVARAQVDVKKIECDALVFSSHKIYGPTGVGVLFARRDLQSRMEPTLVGGGMVEKISKNGAVQFRSAPWKFEAGTPPIEGVVGLKAALEFVTSNRLLLNSDSERSLILKFAHFLAEQPGIRLLGWASALQTDALTHMSKQDLAPFEGILSFTMAGLHPHDLAQTLSDEGVAVRAGHHCAQLLTDRLAPDGCVRISLAASNSIEDFELFQNAFEKCLELRAEMQPQENVCIN